MNVTTWPATVTYITGLHCQSFRKWNTISVGLTVTVCDSKRFLVSRSDEWQQSSHCKWGHRFLSSALSLPCGLGLQMMSPVTLLLSGDGDVSYQRLYGYKKKRKKNLTITFDIKSDQPKHKHRQKQVIDQSDQLEPPRESRNTPGVRDAATVQRGVTLSNSPTPSP